jgi:hypothetical protein
VGLFNLRRIWSPSDGKPHRQSEWMPLFSVPGISPFEPRLLFGVQFVIRPGLHLNEMVTMQSKATTVEKYLAELPAERREAISAIRKVILTNLPKGFEEGMQYGMIGYFVPHTLYPAGYHCDPKQPLPYASLASQKNYMSLYLFCVYCGGGDQSWFREAWTKAGKKLDMGKSCVRFKSLDDVPLSVVGQAIKRMTVKKFIALYEAAMQDNERARENRRAKQPAAKKTRVSKKSAMMTKTARRGARSASKR